MLAAAWPGWPEETRLTLVRRMAKLADDRIELNFGRALRVAVDDESARVRQLAVAALWEDEGSDLIELFLGLLGNDPSQDVRAAAAAGLWRFAAAADAGELDGETGNRIRAAMRDVVCDERSPYTLRRRCLESVAAFSRDPAIWGLIEDAYASDEPGLRASALVAMGRNMSHRWLDAVLAELESGDVELRYEAARASGELGDVRAVPGLAELTHDADADVRNAAITALGQVGGQAAVRVLRGLARDAGEDEQDRIEAAIEEATTSLDPLRAPV